MSVSPEDTSPTVIIRFTTNQKMQNELVPFIGNTPIRREFNSEIINDKNLAFRTRIVCIR